MVGDGRSISVRGRLSREPGHADELPTQLPARHPAPTNTSTGWRVRGRGPWEETCAPNATHAPAIQDIATSALPLKCSNPRRTNGRQQNLPQTRLPRNHPRNRPLLPHTQPGIRSQPGILHRPWVRRRTRTHQTHVASTHQSRRTSPLLAMRQTHHRHQLAPRPHPRPHRLPRTSTRHLQHPRRRQTRSPSSTPNVKTKAKNKQKTPGGDPT